MQTLYEDSRQQIHNGDKHAVKHEWWAAHGVNVVRRTLATGDYATDGSNILVDTKRNMAEIAQNIGGRNHDRFKRECVRAQQDGYRLVVLVENIHGYSSITNVNAWTNEHCVHCAKYKHHECSPHRLGKCLKHGTRKPIQGPRLAKAMLTMQDRYGVRFEFCHPRVAAKRVCELLGVAYE